MEKVTMLRIFLGSPADAAHLRHSACNAVDFVSGTLDAQGMVLKSMTWDRDVAPGVGSEPQAIINEELLVTADMSVFVFHRTIGSPTTRHESGTLEEFEIAVSKRLDASHHRVMVFFDMSAVSPDVDVVQLGKLQEFKRSLSARGVLYQEFEGEKDLRDKVVAALMKACSKIGEGDSALVGIREAHTSIAEAKAAQECDVEADGLLELVGGLEDKARLVNSETTTLSMQVAEFSHLLRAATDSLGIFQFRHNASTQEKADAINTVAERILRHASAISPTVGNVCAATADLVSTVDGLFGEIARGEWRPGEDRTALIQAVSAMRSALSSAAPEFRRAEESARCLPGLTKSLKKARRAVGDQYAAVASALEDANVRLGYSLRRVEV